MPRRRCEHLRSSSGQGRSCHGTRFSSAQDIAQVGAGYAIRDNARPCKASATVKVKGTTIAAGHLSVPPGETSTLRLRLNATGRALLAAAHGHLKATLYLTITPRREPRAPDGAHGDRPMRDSRDLLLLPVGGMLRRRGVAQPVRESG
jgi:hypothetical protein